MPLNFSQLIAIKAVLDAQESPAISSTLPDEARFWAAISEATGRSESNIFVADVFEVHAWLSQQQTDKLNALLRRARFFVVPDAAPVDEIDDSISPSMAEAIEVADEALDTLSPGYSYILDHLFSAATAGDEMALSIIKRQDITEFAAEAKTNFFGLYYLMRLAQFENEAAREALRNLDVASYDERASRDFFVTQVLIIIATIYQNPKAREVILSADLSGYKERAAEEENWVRLLAEAAAMGNQTAEDALQFAAERSASTVLTLIELDMDEEERERVMSQRNVWAQLHHEESWRVPIARLSSDNEARFKESIQRILAHLDPAHHLASKDGDTLERLTNNGNNQAAKALGELALTDQELLNKIWYGSDDVRFSETRQVLMGADVSEFVKRKDWESLHHLVEWGNPKALPPLIEAARQGDAEAMESLKHSAREGRVSDKEAVKAIWGMRDLHPVVVIEALDWLRGESDSDEYRAPIYEMLGELGKQHSAVVDLFRKWRVAWVMDGERSDALEVLEKAASANPAARELLEELADPGWVEASIEGRKKALEEFVQSEMRKFSPEDLAANPHLEAEIRQQTSDRIGHEDRTQRLLAAFESLKIELAAVLERLASSEREKESPSGEAASAPNVSTSDKDMADRRGTPAHPPERSGAGGEDPPASSKDDPKASDNGFSLIGVDSNAWRQGLVFGGGQNYLGVVDDGTPLARDVDRLLVIGDRENTSYVQRPTSYVPRPTSHVPQNWKTLTLEAIAQAKKQGLTKAVTYLELASDKEIRKLFTSQKQLYKKLIEAEQGDYVTRLAQAETSLSTVQILQINAAIKKKAFDEVKLLVDKIAPDPTLVQENGMTLMGNTSGTTLRNSAFMKIGR